jgi:hypothetical protein
MENINSYHKIIIDERIAKLPHYFIRYEDLCTNPQKTLEEIFCFLLEVKSVEGLNIQKRIKQVVELGHSATVVYS